VTLYTPVCLIDARASKLSSDADASKSNNIIYTIMHAYHVCMHHHVVYRRWPSLLFSIHSYSSLLWYSHICAEKGR